MAMQSQIPRLQTAAAPPAAPSTRSTPSPELKAGLKSKISSRPQTPFSGRQSRTNSPEPKSTPKAKIPSRPETPSSGGQSRFGWRPTDHWKPPGAVDGRSQTSVHASPGPEPPSSATTSRLPRLTSWLKGKASASQSCGSKVSSLSSLKDTKTPSNSQENASPSKRDWRDTWWGDSGIPLLDHMHQQNPNPDRSPAVVGEPDNSKRFIRLLNPYGRPIGPDSQDPIAQMVYPKNVDWFERDEVNALNRWRKAVFDHYLGPTEVEEVEWHPFEDEFVLREYSAMVKEVEERQDIVGMGEGVPSWATITRDFNRRFEGKRSEGAGSRLRPEVTRDMLRGRYIELRRSGRCLVGDDQRAERQD